MAKAQSEAVQSWKGVTWFSGCDQRSVSDPTVSEGFAGVQNPSLSTGEKWESSRLGVRGLESGERPKVQRGMTDGPGKGRAS